MLTILDQHGATMASGGNLPVTVGGGPEYVTKVEFRNFPLRDREFVLALYVEGKLVGQFTVPNPVPAREFPNWTPEPLPATKRIGDLAVTLTSVDWVTNGALVLSPKIELREGGQLGREWHTRDSYGMHWADVTGREAGYLEPLCLNETAWKLKVSLYRAATGAFHSNEVWTIPNVTLGPAERVNRFGVSNKIDGVSLEIMKIDGPGQFEFDANWRARIGTVNTNLDVNTLYYAHGGSSSTARLDKHHVAVRVQGQKRNQSVVTRIIDEQGRIFAGTPIGSVELQVFLFEPPSDVQTASLQVIVQTAREFEFLVKPPALPRK
jgi:hypothetical protein